MNPLTTISSEAEFPVDSVTEILKEETLACPDCKVGLITISKIAESTKEEVIQALHHNCGTKSFIKKIHGKYIIRPATEKACILEFHESKHTIIEVQT